MSLFFRSSFLLLYISALHWGDCGRNTAYGGNDFFDLYIGKWFDRNPYVTLGFAAYIVFVYICVYLVYKCRRRIDDKILNSYLKLFKTRTDNK